MVIIKLFVKIAVDMGARLTLNSCELLGVDHFLTMQRLTKLEKLNTHRSKKLAEIRFTNSAGKITDGVALLVDGAMVVVHSSLKLRGIGEIVGKVPGCLF